MGCMHCGAALAPGAGFCGACGQRQEPPAAQGQQGYAPPQQPPYGQPQGHGYPPPPQGYAPPQGHGHPPPPQGYAPQGQGYPPPQGQGYPPPQGYAPQGGYPPPQPPGQQGPQGYPPPPQGPQGYAQPGYPQHGQQGQPGYPPPGPHGYPSPQPGYPSAQGMAPAMGYGAPIEPFGLVMQRGMTRLTGQMFIAPHRLIFICVSNKGGLAVAIGKGLGGIVGGLVAAAGIKGAGQGAPTDEATLLQLVPQHEGSLVMEPQQIKAIKDTFWTHAIWFQGKTYALPDGLPKTVKPMLGQWCNANNVKHAGLIKA